MPVWLVILLLGAGGCGWLFLKARQMETANTIKKVKAGHKSVKAAAKKLAKSGERPPVYQSPHSDEVIDMSHDIVGKTAKTLEQLMGDKK